MKYNFYKVILFFLGNFLISSNCCLGLDLDKTNEAQHDKVICKQNGGGYFFSPQNFKICYLCSKEIDFRKEKFEQYPAAEIFSDEEVDEYAKNFLPLVPYSDYDNKIKSDLGKRYCFSYLNGQFSKLDDDPPYWKETWIYEREDMKTQPKTGNQDDDHEYYYSSGQLLEKRWHSDDGKICFESYYNNGQLRTREWYAEEEKNSNVKTLNGEKLMVKVEKMIGLEEYYKNGQLRIRIEKGKFPNEIQRYSLPLPYYINVPYELFYSTGKLKEKRFEDGRTERYWENGNIKEKCPYVEGGFAGNYCCQEYDENGEEIQKQSCHQWIV